MDTARNVRAPRTHRILALLHSLESRLLLFISPLFSFAVESIDGENNDLLHDARDAANTDLTCDNGVPAPVCSTKPPAPPLEPLSPAFPHFPLPRVLGKLADALPIKVSSSPSIAEAAQTITVLPSSSPSPVQSPKSASASTPMASAEARYSMLPTLDALLQPM